MNTHLASFSENYLLERSGPQIAAIYNDFADELEVGNVKKFTDKKTAVRRTLKIQAEYFDAAAIENAKVEEIKPAKKAPAKKTKVKDDTKIHGLVKTDELQIAPDTKIRKGTILEVIANGYETLHIETVEDIIGYVVENAPKNPKRKPMTSAYAAEYIKWYIGKGNMQTLGKFEEDSEEL